jgi:hypothetical protein
VSTETTTSKDVKDILIDLGYSLQDRGREWRTKPLYRDSDNSTSLRIYKDTGKWSDFARGFGGDIDLLVKLTLNLSDIDTAKKWLTNRNFVGENIDNKSNNIPIEYQKFFSNDILKKLEPDHAYWVKKRNVSLEAVKQLKGGLYKKGKMAWRYVFPVLDKEERILGFSGRSIFDNNEIKWKHYGPKRSWSEYPLFLTQPYIEKEKECILIESIGDFLRLWDAGIRNTLICFGIDSADALCMSLVSLDPDRIIIAFNNDKAKGGKAGNIAAIKTKKKLLNFFEPNQIQIKLPTKNDFGDMTIKDCQQWKNNE